MENTLYSKYLCRSEVFKMEFNHVSGKDGSKVTTVVATPGQGPDRPQEVSYADMKLIGNGSFGVVYQAKLCDTGELIAIKKVLQDKRFKVSPVQLHLPSIFIYCSHQRKKILWLFTFQS